MQPVPKHARRAGPYALCGRSLLETCAVVAVVGTLAAIAIPAFVRELRTSKLSEPAEQLAELHARVATYYAAAQPDGLHCLPPSAGPTPRIPSTDARQVTFAQAPEPAGPIWQALGFEPTRPIRFRYTLTAPAVACLASQPTGGPPPIVVLRAEGDLDGDGTLSRFERRAEARPDGRLVPVGALLYTDAVE